MIKHPQSGTFCHPSTQNWMFLPSPSWDGLFIWSGCWDRRREEEEGQVTAREEKLCPPIAFACVIVCVCVVHEQNIQSGKGRSAWHGTYSVNGADPDSFSVCLGFFCKSSRTYRPPFVYFSSPGCLHHSHSSSVLPGKTWTTAPFFSLAVTRFLSSRCG